MRRQIFLQDYEIPTLQYNITTGGIGGKKQFGFNTQYKSQKAQIQTNIVNGNKQSFGMQITEQIISFQSLKPINPAQKQTAVNQPQVQALNQQTQKKLDRFMRKIVPLMQKQMNQNFPLYQSSFLSIQEFGLGKQKKYFKKQTRLTYTLQNLDNPDQQGLIISDVAWNSTAVMVAAVYAKAEHNTSCSHKSMICLWSMFKRNFKPTKPQIIYTNNCISCIQFHPKKPSVLAVGNYIGQVLLYDLSKKNQQLLSKTLVDDYFHRDVISQICWWPFKLPGKSDINYNLLSLGTDGKILLWEVPTIALGEEAPQNRIKALMKYPIKGYSILRKKQGVVIPVSALCMKQSKANKNTFIIGSQGGSILKASLTPINHYTNTQGKILLDMQQGLKYKKQVYPFLLNVPQKQFRQLKQFIEKGSKLQKRLQIGSVQSIYQLKPQIRYLYPNSITFAYSPLSHPISSLSFNRYNIFVVNGCDGYSRIFLQNNKQHLQTLEQGYQWAWIDQGTIIAGFIATSFVLYDWLKQQILYDVPVGEGIKWKQSTNNTLAIVADANKIKILQLGDKILKQHQNFNQLFNERMAELTSTN